MILFSPISLERINKSETDRIRRNELSNILFLGVWINTPPLEKNLAISKIRGKESLYNFDTTILHLGIYPYRKSIVCNHTCIKMFISTFFLIEKFTHILFTFIKVYISMYIYS